MTRKDYELIAKAFAEAVKEPGASSGVRLVARFLAIGLKVDNPRFDQVRFLRACGFGDI